MHNKAIRRTVYAMSLTSVALLIGCEQTVAKLSPASSDEKAAMAQRNFKTEADNPTDRILLSDEKVYLDTSGMRNLEDRRPFYVVEGRVTSNLLYANADQVIVKVMFVNPDGEMFDSADIRLNDISPQSTKAFKNLVQLLPPTGKHFNYTFEVDSVKTSPALHPWPNLH